MKITQIHSVLFVDVDDKASQTDHSEKFWTSKWFTNSQQLAYATWLFFLSIWKSVVCSSKAMEWMDGLVGFDQRAGAVAFITWVPWNQAKVNSPLILFDHSGHCDHYRRCHSRAIVATVPLWLVTSGDNDGFADSNDNDDSGGSVAVVTSVMTVPVWQRWQWCQVVIAV